MTSVHHSDSTGQTGFQFTPASGGCDCPIHHDSNPVTAPLGLRFAERVQIEAIPQHVAGAIYEAHHSYMDDIPLTNLVHHGLSYQGQLMGAITWRHPLIRSLKLDETRYGGDEIVEAARICIGVDFPNLASAALARSMDQFIRREARRRGIRLLLTFVRADYSGSMVKALRAKGGTVRERRGQAKQGIDRTSRFVRRRNGDSCARYPVVTIAHKRQLSSGQHDSESDSRSLRDECDRGIQHAHARRAASQPDFPIRWSSTDSWSRRSAVSPEPRHGAVSLP
ncbi:hypothetical protein C498_10971 [Haloferax volcanii DS2]|uniref:Uncharacterized protein n=1 Tax=Haloferax volcanii (strain ATCC 29605 / DSM 3757 / JCM 8879 / NBRC 14742 / NCIMB 2012 / VKM B-1768 / DS2) TaxID=309800 RepID=A0A384LBW5_HALVD|nr:hypothetical protein C498_10971 [Haloferax volcanii DS2]